MAYINTIKSANHGLINKLIKKRAYARPVARKTGDLAGATLFPPLKSTRLAYPMTKVYVLATCLRKVRFGKTLPFWSFDKASPRTKHSKRLSEGSCRGPKGEPSFLVPPKNSPRHAHFFKWTWKKFFRTAKKFFKRFAFLPTKIFRFQQKISAKAPLPARQKKERAKVCLHKNFRTAKILASQTASNRKPKKHDYWQKKSKKI